MRNWLYILVYGFFMFFFLIYIGRFGLSNFIIIEKNTWDVLFNVGVWFVLTMFCADNFFKELKQGDGE